MSHITCHCLLLHNKDNLIFVEKQPDGWHLPTVQLPVNSRWWEVDEIVSRISLKYNIKVRSLRCIPATGRLENDTDRIYELECIDDVPEDLHDHWIEINTKEQERFASKKYGLAAANLLIRKIDSKPSSPHEPWTRPGWFDRVQKFFNTSPKLADIPPSKTWIQLRAWSRSSIFKISTIPGEVFFKALPPMSHFEPSVTALVTAHCPSLVPDVLAINKDEGWIVLQGIKGSSPSNGKPTAQDIPFLELALCDLAKAQRKLAAHIDEFIQVGCPALWVDEIPTILEELTTDQSSLLVGKKDGLTPKQVTALSESLPKLRRWCQELASGPIRPSLEHGDFRCENILVETATGRPRIIDFGAASITHPFFSAINLIEHDDFTGSSEEKIVAKIKLRSAYLSVWKEEASFPKLERLYLLSRIIAPVYAAIQRFQILIPGVESKNQWASSVPYWLKLYLDELLDLDLKD